MSDYGVRYPTLAAETTYTVYTQVPSESCDSFGGPVSSGSFTTQ